MEVKSNLSLGNLPSLGTIEVILKCAISKHNRTYIAHA